MSSETPTAAANNRPGPASGAPASGAPASGAPASNHGSHGSQEPHEYPRAYGFELPMLLFAGFRSIIDELHVELARRGHPDFRPAHGFALQAIGLPGATAAEVGRRLGVSKQAAGKTTERLEELGYVYRAGDQADRRRKLIRLSPHGIAVLTLSAMIFNDIQSRWEASIGAGRLAALESDLRAMAPGETFRLDVPGWFGS